MDFAPVVEPAGKKCRPCQRVHPPFNRAVAFGSYDGTLRDLIHLLKFNGVRPLAPVLGRMLAESIADLEPFLPPGTIGVIPVPLYARKKTQRGFNQAEAIARAALKRLSSLDMRFHLRFEYVPGGLLRSRETGSQIGLSRHERRENLRGAFTVGDPTRIEGRYILLIDDVYTTGATASECARVLLRAGAKQIWVATVARTLKLSDMTLSEGLAQEGVSQGDARDGGDDREPVVIASHG